MRGRGAREQDGENLLGQGSDVPKLPARSVGPANAIQGGRVSRFHFFFSRISNELNRVIRRINDKHRLGINC